MDYRAHYEEIASWFEELGRLHTNLAQRLALPAHPSFAETDKVLYEAELTTATTCARLAAAIRNRPFIDSPAAKAPLSATTDRRDASET